MKTKNVAHTPGPWVFGKFTAGPRAEIVDPVSGHPIAEVINWDPATMIPEEQYYQGHPHYHGGRNECPNARLIAAAPDLLAALTECLNVEAARPPQTKRLEHMEMIRAAIAKAEGREG